jgi:hypothetical protein
VRGGKRKKGSEKQRREKIGRESEKEKRKDGNSRKMEKVYC